MRPVRWSRAAQADLLRHTKFLAGFNPQAADRAAALLKIRVGQIKDHPRLGERVPGHEPREVRRLVAGPYEVHYELTTEAATLLRVFHTREGR